MAGAVRGQLDVAAKAASYNMLLQVLLRVATFVMNGFVLRFIHADLLGVVNMRLTLLYSTVLFLSREALRKACLSRTTGQTKWRHVNNLMWCSPVLGLVTSCLVSALWLSPFLKQPNVPYDVIAEPLWVLSQTHNYVKLKVMAEGVPQMIKCLVVVMGVYLAPQWGVVLFSIAQLLYSFLYLVIFYGYFHVHLNTPEGKSLPISAITDIIPHTDEDTKTWCSVYLLHLTWSFFKNSFLKQLLTDGERYVMTIFGVLSFAQQGVYDVINNLGSLVPRFIFLPIEESFYVFFASSLYRGEPPEKQREGVLPGVAHTLAMILKFVIVVAMVILSFGYAYSYLALNIYGGKLLSGGEGPTLLRWYCVYVMLLAVNGVTECFVMAAMSQKQVDRYNVTMLVFSVVFLSASLLLTKFSGSVGFILANCINMACRICHSCRFIHSYFSSTPYRPLTLALPSLPMVTTFALSFLITAFSERVLCCDQGFWRVCLHVLVGVACLLWVGSTLVLREQELTSFMLSRLPTRISSHVLRVMKTLHITYPLPKSD
eukprot:Em0001g3795a